MNPPKALSKRAASREKMARWQRTAREKIRKSLLQPPKFALFFKIAKIVFESDDWFAKIADTHGHGELSERPKEHAC